MKKLSILSLLSLFILLSSCGKLPMNGQLDGMWQLMHIAPTAGEEIDTKEQRLYYLVQLELLGLQRGGSVEYLGRFVQSSDSLIVYDFRVHISGDNSTQAVAGDLLPWGIKGTSAHFAIEKLDGKNMLLRSDEALLTFRKF